MGKERFSEEFKAEAIKQITERGYSIAEVSKRVGVSTHSLYAWIKRFSSPAQAKAEDEKSAEVMRLKSELLRVPILFLFRSMTS